MGRIPKVDKERALEEARRKEQDRQLHDHMRQLQQKRDHPATVMVSGSSSPPRTQGSITYAIYNIFPAL